MGKFALTLLRSTDLSMAYIPCCAIVLMLHNVPYKKRCEARAMIFIHCYMLLLLTN